MQLNHHRTGSGEPLVLIHGIGHHWRGWLPVIERIRGEREVVAIDLPGFGSSPMPPPGTPPGARALSGLVADFLDEQGLDRPHVAGNSLGGWIALELAKRGRARSATGLSPAGFYNWPEARFVYASLWLARRMSRTLEPLADRIARVPAAVKAGFGQLAAHPERIPPDELAATMHALAQAPWFDVTLAAITSATFSGGEQIRAPVTIAWGEKDRLLLPHQSKRAARAIPQAEIVTLRGCGHVPFHDDPDQVAQVVLDGSA